MEVVGRWLWLWHIQLSAPKFVLSIFVLYLILGSRCSARTHFSVSPPSSLNNRSLDRIKTSFGISLPSCKVGIIITDWVTKKDLK